MKQAVFGGPCPKVDWEKGEKKHSGGKMSKKRITIAFLVSATSANETPVVIWNSTSPRCFVHGFDVRFLPVKYYKVNPG